jgi:glycosyltransferase involved in cell wall biosynthesis
MARICLIRQYYVPLDTRVKRELDALVAAGHQVTVLCMKRPGEARVERSAGATIVRMPLRHRRGKVARYCFEHLAFVLLAGAAATAGHLRRPYDLVQVNTMPDTLVVAALGPRLLGAPVLLDLHECMPEAFATTFDAGPMPVRVLEWLERLSIRFADRAITCTDLMRDAFVGRGAPPEKVSVVLNGADENVFDPDRYPPGGHDPRRMRLVSHGTVEPRYGLETAVRAVAILEDEMPGVELQVYGEGSQLDDLRRLTEELGVGDRVHLSGRFVPIDELVAGIAEADAGVVAIERDEYRDLTLCNKMYDFIAMRKPALVSRTRSVEEYFGDACFQMFDSGDPDDLARAIRELHARPDGGAGLVEAASRANATHRWAVQREVYLSVVDELLARPAQTTAAAPATGAA